MHARTLILGKARTERERPSLPMLKNALCSAKWSMICAILCAILPRVRFLHWNWERCHKYPDSHQSTCDQSSCSLLFLINVRYNIKVYVLFDVKLLMNLSKQELTKLLSECRICFGLWGFNLEYFWGTRWIMHFRACWRFVRRFSVGDWSMSPLKTPWIIWDEQNDLIFNGEQWPLPTLILPMYLGGFM